MLERPSCKRLAALPLFSWNKWSTFGTVFPCCHVYFCGKSISRLEAGDFQLYIWLFGSPRISLANSLHILIVYCLYIYDICGFSMRVFCSWSFVYSLTKITVFGWQLRMSSLSTNYSHFELSIRGCVLVPN
jgi:hypothetical protein